MTDDVDAAVGLLRETAALMHQRADLATPGRWETMRSGAVLGHWPGASIGDTVAHTFPAGNGPKHNAELIASWDPDTTRAAADMLTALASNIEAVQRHNRRFLTIAIHDYWAYPPFNGAVRFARTYLRRNT